MWESPIKMYDEICRMIIDEKDRYILQAVAQSGVNIDKEELIKALQYDRHQYEKGYTDGRMSRDAEIVRCYECKHKAEGQDYCYKHGIWLHRMRFCSVGERESE